MLAAAAQAVVFKLSALGALVSSARGMPPAGLTTRLLGRGETRSGFAIQLERIRLSARDAVEVVVTRLVFAPGGTSGWHASAGPALVIVASGTVTKYSADDCDARTFTTGEAFILYGPSDRNMLRNEGAGPAEAIVSCISLVASQPHGAPRELE
jgi:quercetin dioxygenase-like cupin family protein